MSHEEIKKISAVLISGGIAVIPTDTVYGLAACYSNREAVARIFSIKKRPHSKPLPVLIPSVEYAWSFAAKDEFTASACSKYWPGAVTLIMNAKDNGSIALRVPDCSITLEILHQAGPLAATSANISGSAAPASFKDISSEIINNSDICMEADQAVAGKASSIIDIRERKTEILRK